MRSKFKDHQMGNTIMAIRHERWSYILALLGVLALVLVVISNTVFGLYDTAKQAVTSQREISSILNLHTSAKQNANYKKANISDLALFGTAPTGVEAATNTNFNLLGIEYSATHPELAKAIINTGSKDGIFKVGDKLSQGVVILSITNNSVIILQNGIKQKLNLSWDSAGGVISHQFESVNLNSNSDDDNTPSAAQQPGGFAGAPGGMMSPNQSVPVQYDLNALKQQYLNLQKNQD